MKILKLFCLILIFNGILFAQKPYQLTSGEIYKSIEKLNFLGNVLFVAAHPDDENTRVISHFVNQVNAHTTYLSLTRGDGGQNLIGPEIEELLGVIRTQELLMARKTDGGHQLFTRANDFGYSKNSEETIKIWDNEKVKEDVVWAIRKTRPDVIINRFDHRTSGSTHGHHTASAILTHELFEAAADAKTYPNQLKFVLPWQSRRLFFNVSWFFFGSQDAFEKADKSKFLSFDAGTYIPLLGKSNNEIAALSRSNHKCQGFGSTGTRGTMSEYLELVKGDMPLHQKDVFEGINTTWTRIEGGQKIKDVLDQVQNEFDFISPNKSIPKLLEAKKLIDKIEDQFWKERKSKEITNIISSCLGLYVDAFTNTHSAVKGERVKIDLEATKRLSGNVILNSIEMMPNGFDTIWNIVLNDNTSITKSFYYSIPREINYTNSYWLNEKRSKGMYRVDQQEFIGLPQTLKDIQVKFHFSIDGVPLTIEKEVSYKYNSPENGESYRPFEITPNVFVSVENKVYLFTNELPQKVKIKVTAGASNQKGILKLPLPEGWSVNPSSFEFDIKEKMNSQEFIFEIISSKVSQEEITVSPVAIVDHQIFNKQLIEIKYDHIPMQMIFLPAESRFLKLDLKIVGSNIAYVQGAGDDVASSLRQAGFKVTEIKAKEIKPELLEKFSSVILGIRAYNVDEDLKFKQDILFEYVKNGGNVVVQYNTNNGLVVGNKLAPYSINISRERVTMEDAPVTFLEPNHDLLNYPNKITTKDFENWVQERGLYFANEWDTTAFKPILSCNDTGDSPKKGGLLVAKYGEGNFIYTGYSWFRQLPSGVSGAFRLFANMLALGIGEKP